jgi:hypothetical protein
MDPDEVAICMTAVAVCSSGWETSGTGIPQGRQEEYSVGVGKDIEHSTDGVLDAFAGITNAKYHTTSRVDGTVHGIISAASY